MGQQRPATPPARRRAARRPTLRDVGERAGVSFKTVSRVVNGEGNVSPELAERVRAAIDELGYRTDPAASTLRRTDGRTNAVAVIVDDLANPFAATVHRAVVDAMRERGVLVLSASSDEDPEVEHEAFLAFVDRRVDGLLLMPTSADHAWLAGERAGDAPVVMVDRPAHGFEADVVVSDNREGAARATAHLVRHGHRRVAFLGDLPSIWTAAERLAGYRDALEAAGLRPDPALERTGLRDARRAREAVAGLLAGPQPPTALFAAQNLAAIGAIRALRDVGRHHEVALVGFDDVELADLLDPGVTVVAQDAAEIGRVAAEQLLRRLDGDRSPSAQRVVPTRVLQRGSGEIAPG